MDLAHEDRGRPGVAVHVRPTRDAAPAVRPRRRHDGTATLDPCHTKQQEGLIDTVWVLGDQLNVDLAHLRDEVVERVVDAFHERDDVPINSVEGFVRQVIGWREYVHGLYWLYEEGVHEARLRGNHRMARTYATLDRLDDGDEVRTRARSVLARLPAGTL